MPASGEDGDETLEINLGLLVQSRMHQSIHRPTHKDEPDFVYCMTMSKIRVSAAFSLNAAGY